MKKIAILLLMVLIALGISSCNGSDKYGSITDEDARKQLADMKDYGIDLYQKTDYLPLLNHTIFSEQQSSYSRNGNNADGLGLPDNVSGEVNENNYIRPLLELNQPGVIYRMWFTNWSSMPRLRIFIDGEETPSYNLTLTDMSSGEVSPFLKPLVFDQNESSGGFVSIVPIVFKKSIKIIGTGDFYYNINYQKYPNGTELEYDQESQIEAVKDIFEATGRDPKIFQNDSMIKKGFDLLKGQSIILYDSDEKQTVTSLTLNFDSLTTWFLDRTKIEDVGIKINANTVVKFKMKVNSDDLNSIRFRSVLLDDFQRASIEVDDVFIANLEIRARRLNGFEWKDNPYYHDEEFLLPNELTRDKKEVTITIKTQSDMVLYRAWTVSNDKNNDEIMFGETSNEQDHNYQESRTSAPVSSVYEYDPNSLIDEKTWSQIFIDEDIVNSMWIKITYKDQSGTAVYVPISSFFGFGAYGMFETLGLMAGLKSDGTMYFYYPMPFEAGIKIELVNKSDTDLNDINFTLTYEKNYFEKGKYGYFKVNYISHVHNSETSLKHGEPITFFNVEGSGKVVGITHSASGAYFGIHSRFYLEGDEQIYLDGSKSHSFHGTGTEDFYNGGWYFKNGVQTNPTFGQSNHNYRDNRDRTVMFRSLITDPIVFRSSINFMMEHGGWNERIDVDVYAAVYYYQAPSVLQRTDQVLFDDDLSLENHQYQTDESSKFVSNNTRYYEGYYNNQQTPYQRVSEVKEHSTFKVNILSQNKGIILRREYVMNPLNQMANVYVDGVLVGIWQSSFRNGIGIHVRQDDFYIPSSYTENKQELTIKIEVIPNSESSIWTESFYEIYSIKKGD